ncbi:DivIVA domain-containing protein [Canibacter sp. lx-72]|uniref:DivIVA domain-containing protein n=1 Tax=Canibacter zhuwentaonis TaxID=2837491 RepID=UPI001BDD963F|nr:DivIVA domain-containing protein [Canibacter zhuwentaonis]MBT1018253.1 DivIVA domain-containing protein [Canibacter zhuwentaonis]
MALTPEHVKTKTFTITKFRDGYEPDQVDDFLDEIVADLDARDAEREQLQKRVAELTAELEAARAGKAESAAGSKQAAAPIAASVSGTDMDVQKSSAMLKLALELHDKHINEGKTKRAQLISEGEAEASRIVSEATAKREEQLRRLTAESFNLETKIEELKGFEKEYRATLKSYIESQLKGLNEGLSVSGGSAR